VRAEGLDLGWCPVHACKAEISADKLMCLAHWRLLPPPQQREIYRTWRAFVRCFAKRDAASLSLKADYERARAAAIAAVNARLEQAP